MNGFVQFIAFLVVLIVILVKLYWGFIQTSLLACFGSNICFDTDEDYEGNPPLHIAKSKYA